MTSPEYDADVVIVGAGPGGSTAAYWLAQAGLSVIACEKTKFPREKVCGDGLTPRAVKQLVAMGIDPEVWLVALETPPDRLSYFSPESLIRLKLATRLSE